MMNEIDETILTVEELQERLGVGRNKAYELVKTGEIKAIRNGKRYLIPAASISEYISRSTNLNYFMK